MVAEPGCAGYRPTQFFEMYGEELVAVIAPYLKEIPCKRTRVWPIDLAGSRGRLLFPGCAERCTGR